MGVHRRALLTAIGDELDPERALSPEERLEQAEVELRARMSRLAKVGHAKRAARAAEGKAAIVLLQARLDQEKGDARD